MSADVVKKILVNARKLIENPKNWIQGDFALDAEGNSCLSTEEKAVCFCSIGALRNAANSHKSLMNWGTPAYMEARTILKQKMNADVDDFNDSHTHEEVLTKFDEAINSIVV